MLGAILIEPGPMRLYPHPCSKTRRLLTVAGMSMLALTLASPVRAQEDDDLDLKPAELSPDEPLAVRVDDLQPGEAGSQVRITVANRTDRDAVAGVECSLFDKDREDLGTASGRTPSIGAGQSVVMTIAATAEGAKRAYCRIGD